MKLTIDEINLLLSGLAARNDALRDANRKYDGPYADYQTRIDQNMAIYDRLIAERDRIRRSELNTYRKSLKKMVIG